MSTVKITDLPKITLDANTSNSIFVMVDVTSDTTNMVTGTQIANNLYLNNTLNVGANPVLLHDVSAQFSGNNADYLQINNQNFASSGSVDYIGTADIGSDANNYIDFGINNSTYSDPLYSSSKALDGYLYVHGSTDQSYTGNLVLGTSSSHANVVLIAGGTTSSNVVGRISSSVFDLLKDVRVTGNTSVTGSYVFNDGTIQSTSANTTINSANTWLQANTGAGIIAANTWLQANYLSNTSGALFNGVLNVGDKLNVNGSVIFANTNFTPTQAALTIAACPIGNIQPPSNDGYMLHISGKQDVSSRIVFDSFGANTYAVIAGRTARGTPVAPQAVLNGDILMRLSGNGYGTTKYSTLGSGRIDIVASENFTDNSRATQIQFFTTVSGTNNQTQIASFNGSSAIFTGVINPQKGFIYTPNVVSGIVNTLSIDVANTSLIKYSVNATATIALTNYYPGKVVEIWVTNTDTGGGSNHTITHGCLANNSTVGASSFTLTSQHSAYLRYFSIGTDNANTFVSISYS